MRRPPPVAAALPLDPRRLQRFVGRTAGVATEAVRLRLQVVGGGLDSRAVVAVDACLPRAPWRRSFVVKVLTGDARREAAVYAQLLAARGGRLAPALLGIEEPGDGEVWLYLERVVPWRRWPWPDTALTARLLERLGEAHACWPSAPAVREWKYDQALQASARTTLELFDMACPERLRPGRRYLQRMVESLPRVRRQLAAGDDVVTLHGDLHPGNVLVRLARGVPEVVLVDWGRARAGSALEDVSSWLQSLGYWEPEARRRHDSLLQRYMGARGLPTVLSREVRDRYWLAAACNGLAGALRYHIAVAGDPARPPRHRRSAEAAARDWLRIIRRADACWGAAAA